MNAFLWFTLIVFALKALELAGEWAWRQILIAQYMEESRRVAEYNAQRHGDGNG